MVLFSESPTLCFSVKGFSVETTYSTQLALLTFTLLGVHVVPRRFNLEKRITNNLPHMQRYSLVSKLSSLCGET